MVGATPFFTVADDVVLTILFKLQSDPRDWARIACVCRKFSSLIRHVCWKTHLLSTIPSVVADISPGNDWSSLHKVVVCCPGLHHAGVLLENSDFGLERDLGPDETFRRPEMTSSGLAIKAQPEAGPSWSLYDDLYDDTIYDSSENNSNDKVQLEEGGESDAAEGERNACDCDRQKIHVANAWNLSREPGNKLLASRFRGDTLYICDWPGCVHGEAKRNYMLFRGIFKNFKSSRVWRSIADNNRSKIDLECAFCDCDQTWDLHSAFCLKRYFKFHDDGDPVVRAYVCENGHVSGAWTDLPLYS